MKTIDEISSIVSDRNQAKEDLGKRVELLLKYGGTPPIKHYARRFLLKKLDWLECPECGERVTRKWVASCYAEFLYDKCSSCNYEYVGKDHFPIYDYPL